MTTSRTLILNVVPTLSAPRHGIIDYAHRLNSRLEQTYEVASEIFTSEKNGRPDNDHTSLSAFQRRLREETRSKRFTGLIIFFHFDYGSYGWWDVPIWLLGFFSALKRLQSKVRTVLFVHEFHPASARRRRERVLLPLSKRVLAATLNRVDLVICSNSSVQTAVKHLCSDVPILQLPVFSNIGEPDCNVCCEGKESGRWVVFGSTGNLLRYLRCLLNELHDFPPGVVPRSLDVIGGVFDSAIETLIKKLHCALGGCKIHYRPGLPAAECSAAFNQAEYCYLPYLESDNPRVSTTVLKSGVFAAANAHGVITLFGGNGAIGLVQLLEHPGLGLRQRGKIVLPSAGRELSKRIHAWYHQHTSLGCASSHIAKTLGLSKTTEQ